MGDNTDEEMFEDWEEVRAGYRRKDEELASMENHQLFGYMQDIERLFSQVAALQEADLSRLCRQQAEQHDGGGGGQPISRQPRWRLCLEESSEDDQ